MAQIAAHSTKKLFGSSVLLFFLGLVLTAFSARYPQTAKLGAVIVSELTTPVQNVVSAIEGGIVNTWERYIYLINVKTENDALKLRLAALEAENSRLLEFEHENIRLRSVMNLAEQEKFTGVAANVIGYDPSNWIKSVVVNKGSADGIIKDQPVIDGKGLVGHVVSVSRNSSRVLLVSDHASAVDAILQRTRARGIVEGSGGLLARLSYVLAKEDVKVGDRIITSGMDRLYPKGLLIGIVSDVERDKRRLFQRVEVVPTVEFSKLENVLVVTSVEQKQEELE